MKLSINNWLVAFTIALFWMLSSGCDGNDKGSTSSVSISSQIESQPNPRLERMDEPVEGEILNELTRTQLRLAELKYSDGRADDSIAQIKKTLMGFNYVVLVFERRKQQGASLEANQKLLDEISYKRSGMTHAELSRAVKEAMKDLENI